MTKIEQRDNVLMTNATDGLRFIEKPLGRRDTISDNGSNDLEGDFSIQNFMSSQVDHPHAAFGDTFDYAIAVDDDLTFQGIRTDERGSIVRAFGQVRCKPLGTRRALSSTKVVTVIFWIINQGICAYVLPRNALSLTGSAPDARIEFRHS